MAHQPRFGGSAAVSGAVEETTGVGAGEGIELATAAGSLEAAGAGSRMVERRRGGASDRAGSTAAGALGAGAA